jgi:hypothetical protein
MAKIYNLTLSEEQSKLLTKALDLYSRIGIGQFEEILRVYDPLGSVVPLEARDAARRLLDSVKAVYGHPANGSHGIHNEQVRDEFRAAYDIQQVVRHQLAMDQSPDKRGWTVDFDEPRQISQLPLPSIKSTDVPTPEPETYPGVSNLKEAAREYQRLLEADDLGGESEKKLLRVWPALEVMVAHIQESGSK